MLNVKVVAKFAEGVETQGAQFCIDHLVSTRIDSICLIN